MADSVNIELYDRIVDNAAMTRMYEDGLHDKVSGLYDDHDSRMANIIGNANKGKLSAAEQVAIDLEFVNHTSNLYVTSSRDLLSYARNNISFMADTMKSKVGKLFAVDTPYRIADDIVLSKPLYEDMTLSMGWRGISESERKRLDQVIRAGFAKGMSLDDIALAVRRGNVSKISRNQASGLVRTALTSVGAQTDQQVYEANSKILQGYQYTAVLDSRTTQICASRDGHIYPVTDKIHLPPAHWWCRSKTIPIVKKYDDMVKSESVQGVLKRNLADLTPAQRAYYDGMSPLQESYNDWLMRQPADVQLRHLGDETRLDMFRSGQLTLDKFVTPNGKRLTLKQLRAITDPGMGVSGDTLKFASAKAKLDSIKLTAARPDEFFGNKELTKALQDYYVLQTQELDGTLSLTNYRGTLIGSKKMTKRSVLNTPPTEKNLKFNPITGRYEDARMYQPAPAVLQNNLRLVSESDVLKREDKDFITNFVGNLDGTMSVNERAAVTDNLRITFGRFRQNQEPWGNLKSVLNGQIKFDVMNVSDSIETQLRADANLFKKLAQDQYIDPVLGTVQLDDLSKNFLRNIKARNTWEDRTAIAIGYQLKGIIDLKLPPVIRARLSENQLLHFYTKMAKKLALNDLPDRDQLAVTLGRELYNLANMNGQRNSWWKLGCDILDSADDKGFYKLETYGVQKRRMKSRNGGRYFGPYYDTFAVNLRIVDPRIQEYGRLTRMIDVGLRVPVVDDSKQLYIREGYKTYFMKDGLGMYDTRIPITSTDSFRTFPTELVDADMAAALNWTAQTKYKIDEDMYDFINNLLNFRDDKGKAAYYDSLNSYREYIAERGDAYERFKSMEWLRQKNAAFSTTPFLDHRCRVYERSFIGPQSGETFRPFLNSEKSVAFSKDGFVNFQDQIGAFLGGLNDNLEGRFNSLSVLGRQGVAEKWRSELISLGDAMRRNKPNDIRAILDSDFMAMIDGEDQGKAMRFALEMSRINEFLGGDFSAKSLERLSDYQISLALEQDASSSGAQIIALTTKNRQLAELSNVIPTNQKQRLYDEIAGATFNDPRFVELNKKLGLSEKDLRKAAKAQNMVTFYGAGERTGIMNVENKLAKALGKNDDMLVVKAADRDTVLAEISARIAKYEKLDPEMAEALRNLRQDVKDVFNKGLHPGDDMMDALYFLDPKTADLVEKMTRQYDKVVTPDDFTQIASIMSEHLAEQVPILKDFTKFFGRLAEDFAINSKPKKSALVPAQYLKQQLLGKRSGGKRLPKWLSVILGIKDEAIRDKFLNRIPLWNPNGTLANVMYGVEPPAYRRTGFKVGKYEVFSMDLTPGVEIGDANKMPKAWTQIPWVNFDGKIVEQHFTQAFEERLAYKDANGNWVNNILQVPQKTEISMWEAILNKKGKINSIIDAQKARTAYAVNGNHSNDATIVKQFHIWGAKSGVATSTVHDAFVTNAGLMLNARSALRRIYSRAVANTSIQDTLKELYNRGLPRELYLKYLKEAQDIGLIPVAGRSEIGGRVISDKDILRPEDVLQKVDESLGSNRYWYGIG